MTADRKKNNEAAMLRLLALIVFGVCVDTRVSAESSSHLSRPNIVIFVSDDMGWNDVGYHGSNIRTPNLDRLAGDGMKLERFYVHPICSPTRTAMMTGRSPARFGITGPLGGSQGVPPDEFFLPQAFQAAGYQTFMTGKWHLGAVGDEYSPQSRGFDHFYGFRGGVIDYYTHIGTGEIDWQRNGTTLHEEGYSTKLFADEAVRLISQRDPDRPVFLYVPFNAPHGPTQAPEELVRRYASLGRRGSFAAAVEAMDHAIGRILAMLETEQMTRNTLVLFFCDNGPKAVKGASESRGSKQGRAVRVSSAAPEGLALRGGKSSVLEGGIRVPAVLRWPDVISAGAACDTVISALDLLPTLTSAAGVEFRASEPLDGINMWPAISDNEVIDRAPIVIAGQRGEFAAIDFPLKLIAGADGDFLYDIHRDPTESQDLAAGRPNDVARLKLALEPFAQNRVRGNRSHRRPGSKMREKRPRR